MKNTSMAINKASYLVSLDKYEEALSLYENQLGLHIFFDSIIYNQMAYCFYLMEEYEKSIKSAQRVFEFKPECPIAFYNMSLSLWELRHFEKAHFFIDKAIEIDPSNNTYLLRKARLLLNESNFEECDKYLVLVEKSEPNKYMLLSLKCHHAYFTNEKEKFEILIENALSIYPNDAHLIHLKSHGYLRLNDFANSVKYAKKSLSIDPTNELAKETLKNGEKGLETILPIGLILFIIIRVLLLIFKNQ